MGDEEGHEAQGNEGCRGGGAHESNEGHEGDEEGHEAPQGNEGCRGGGTHESNESNESHEGYESYEGYEESHEGDESNEGHEGYEEVKCGGEKCDLSSLLVGDGHEQCLVASSCGGVPRPAPLYNHW